MTEIAFCYTHPAYAEVVGKHYLMTGRTYCKSWSFFEMVQVRVFDLKQIGIMARELC